MAPEMPKKTARELAVEFQSLDNVSHSSLAVDVDDDGVSEKLSVWLDEDVSDTVVDMFTRGLKQFGFDPDVSVANTGNWWVEARR